MAASERRFTAFVGAAGLATLVVAWEGSTRLGVLDTSAFPPLSDVLDALGVAVSTQSFWTALGETAESTLLGLAISVAIALPLGVLLGLNHWAFRSTRFLVEFLKPIPVVAILPLALLIYGTALEMKLLLIAFGTLWPLLIQVLYGVHDIDPVVADTARAFRLGRLRRLISVVLPSAAPVTATGLRLAAVTALVLSIVTELVGGAPGLGMEIARAQRSADYAELYALVLVSGVLGMGINSALGRVERRVLRWHPAHRAEATA